MQLAIIGCFLGSFMGVFLMYLAITFDPKGDKVPMLLKRLQGQLGQLCPKVFQTIFFYFVVTPIQFLRSQNGIQLFANARHQGSALWRFFPLLILGLIIIFVIIYLGWCVYGETLTKYLLTGRAAPSRSSAESRRTVDDGVRPARLQRLFYRPPQAAFRTIAGAKLSSPRSRRATGVPRTPQVTGGGGASAESPSGATVCST